jgi:crotonobetainyl-CoA:carnitine CoA-transferase CaiB-like acyl-CoA transferase
MSDAQWRALLELMGRRDLMEDRELASVEGRVKHVERVDRVVGDWCRTLRTGDLLGRLSEAKVPAGPVVSIRQLLSDAHFREREMIVQLSMPEGFTLEVPGSIFKLSKTPGMVIAPAPVLGEGNREFTDLTERSEVMTWREERLAPLEGVRVVEMGMHTAVPVAGRLLASMGAEVIKVEPPEGEPARRLALKIGGKESYLYQMNNTDKLSLCLDIAAERDRARLLELLRCSDVFLENFAPGTTDTWGIGPFVLQSVNQGLVYCAVTGFGHAGPLRATRAYDTIIQAMSGLMSLTGYAGTPLKVGASVADQLGACVAAAAVLAALWWRRSSGLGQFIDVSMHDICGWLTMEAWPAVLVSGQDSQQNEGCGRDGSLSDIYECEDGFVGIEIRDISELRTFMEATGVGLGDDLSPGYGEVVGSPSFAAELRELVSTWMRKRRVKDVIEALQVEGVCATPVLGLDEVLRHPHTIFRGMIRTVDVPDLGEVKVLGIPLGLARTPPQIRRAAPRLGEHNDSVFSELGASGRGLS